MIANRPVVTRRAALLGLTSAITFGTASLALAGPAAALPAGQRFVVVILRGALDGLSAVVPYGDRNITVLRAELVPPQPGTAEGLLDLGGFFGLHPQLAGLHLMYTAGDLLALHAVAGPNRSRSHFEAQDNLESGADYRMTSGWLNRVVELLPAAERGASPGGPAITIAASIPLILRGPAMVGSWSPSHLAEPEPDLYARVALLAGDDKLIGPAIAEGLRVRGMAAKVLGAADPAPPTNDRVAFPTLAGFAGRMLAASNGPRIAALEIGGWDTHVDQMRRLSGVLRQLDEGLVALRSGLGDAWRHTVVLAATEFGRTVRMNGTKGTDHGTGAVAFVLGGAVAGGRVRADWPGLAAGKLLEDRDLQPTADLRSAAKGLLAEHLKLSEEALARIFPNSAAATPIRGLVRAGSSQPQPGEHEEP